jgi:hypothetical protein
LFKTAQLARSQHATTTTGKSKSTLEKSMKKLEDRMNTLSLEKSKSTGSGETKDSASGSAGRPLFAAWAGAKEGVKAEAGKATFVLWRIVLVEMLLKHVAVGTVLAPPRSQSAVFPCFLLFVTMLTNMCVCAFATDAQGLLVMLGVSFFSSAQNRLLISIYKRRNGCRAGHRRRGHLLTLLFACVCLSFGYAVIALALGYTHTHIHTHTNKTHRTHVYTYAYTHTCTRTHHMLTLLLVWVCLPLGYVVIALTCDIHT